MTPSLWIAALALLGLMTATWAVSLVRREASVVDFVWGLGFVLTAWIHALLADPVSPRGLLLAGLVSVWGLRLSGYLLHRNWGAGEDRRYAAMRDHWGARFPWVSFFTVFLFQGGLIWFLSLPFHAAQRPGPALGTPLDLLGIALFLAGLFFEAVGDWQLARFKADPANRGRVLDRGLWRYTRHPNYFGDAVVWWGFFLLVLSAPGAAWTVLSPIVMTFLLMNVSGVPMLEKDIEKRRPGYAAYVARTSGFIPWPPRSEPPAAS